MTTMTTARPLGVRARAWRWTAVVVLVALAGTAAACQRPGDGRTGGPVATPGSAAAVPDPPAPIPTSSRGADPIRYPKSGSDTWRVAGGESPVAGTGGPLLRYRVAVERDISGIDVSVFAASLVRVLHDRRSWTGGGQRRLRRVGPVDGVDFTIFLATPATRDRLCGDGSDGYTSCRNGRRVVLNVARWADGAPGYGVSLDGYREYMVNHEVGHVLGYGHERCPGRGRPAPVMQQQTLGLHGCTPNAWPYPNADGRRYAGPSGAYDDPLPAVTAVLPAPGAAQAWVIARIPRHRGWATL